MAQNLISYAREQELLFTAELARVAASRPSRLIERPIPSNTGLRPNMLIDPHVRSAVARQRRQRFRFLAHASVWPVGSSLPLRTSSKHRATSCSHARFLRNAIANEAAAPSSSFEARERID